MPAADDDELVRRMSRWAEIEDETRCRRLPLDEVGRVLPELLALADALPPRRFGEPLAFPPIREDR